MNTLLNLGPVQFPAFTGVRVLMMPFHLHDIAGTIPDFLRQYNGLLQVAVAAAPIQTGTAYLTIDERPVQSNVTHRRPGLHVDAWYADGGSWGGGGGCWGGGYREPEPEPKEKPKKKQKAPPPDRLKPPKQLGMLMAASHLGAQAWNKPLIGTPKEFGDCEHLRGFYPQSEAVPLLGGRLYGLSGLCVHESIPMTSDAARQFLRLSMPSKADWPNSNTPNPLGVPPTGAIVEGRPRIFTDYQSL